MVDVVPFPVYDLLRTRLYFSHLLNLSRYKPSKLSGSERKSNDQLHVIGTQ